MKKSIKKKIQGMEIALGTIIIVLLGVFTLISVMNIRRNAAENLHILNEDATGDATNALQEQMQESLQEVVANKSEIADSALEKMYNQTRQVALAAESIYSNPERYIGDTPVSELPVDMYDFSCNLPESVHGKFSIHLRGPRSVMADDSIEEEDGVVTAAKLDESKLDATMRKELYLATYLEGALDGLLNYYNGDGTFNGIAATYFCIQSSGIDVLADTQTQQMIEYDPRNSLWYQEAAKLGPGEMFWTNPVPDASGRGLAIICSMPVYVDGKLVGVAGTGGGLDSTRDMVQSTTVGAEGYALLVNTANADAVTVLMSGNGDENNEINRYAENLLESDNAELLEVLQNIRNRETGMEQVEIDGRVSYVAYSPLEITQWSMMIVLPLDDSSIMVPIEALKGNIEGNTQATIENINSRILRILGTFIVFVILVAVVVTVLSTQFAKRMTEPIEKLTAGAERVSGGDLDFKLSVRTGDELEILGEAFNTMTVSLVEYIKNLSIVTAERERIGAELDVAAKIQADMLPCIFPAFPERKEFEIYASMKPAKEVGGDFYDFFLVDDNHLAMVMADVSGKGVPAALFMMISKTLLKSAAQTGISPKEVLEKVNNQLCENNDAALFVTVWLGILEISSGKMICANAGHEFPVIKRKDGPFELFQDKHGLVLAAMEDMFFDEYEMQMNEGDILFVYTDGVAEATDVHDELYGTDRLLEALNAAAGADCEGLLVQVDKDISRFVGEAPQFDDITMLCMEYRKMP